MEQYHPHHDTTPRVTAPIFTQLDQVGALSPEEAIHLADGYVPGNTIKDTPLASHNLHAEARFLEQRLHNISDEDLYRVYKNKWVNRDLADGHGTSVRPSVEPPRMHAQLAGNLRVPVGHGRQFHSGVVEAAQEFQADHRAIMREKLLQYVVDPEVEDLSMEQVMGAVFPDLENSRFPGYDMHKFSEKTDELPPQTFAVWNDVQRFYLRDTANRRKYFQEIEPPNGLRYEDPIAAYEFDYDPLTRLLRTVKAKQGNLEQMGNPWHQAQEELQNLYDTDSYNRDVRSKLARDDILLSTPKSTYFLQYAKAKLQQARYKKDKIDEQYWSEVVRPFEYVPREDPLPRPTYIETPEKDLISFGMSSTNTPLPASLVEFDYIAHAKDTPNKVIDSTYRNGERIRLMWGRDYLPRCLQMMLSGVAPGSRVKITCPPRFLFGEQGWPERGYPAHTDIVFDVMMHSVTKPLPTSGALDGDVDYTSQSPY